MEAVLSPRRLRRPVEVTRSLPFPAPAVRALLETDPMAILVRRGKAAVVAVRVQLAPHVRLEREIAVRFGPFVREDDGSVNLALWWEAAHQPNLFPTFDGGLEVRSGDDGAELGLVGSYVLPLGHVGAFADELIGGRLARASLEAFMDDITSAVTARLRSDR